MKITKRNRKPYFAFVFVLAAVSLLITVGIRIACARYLNGFSLPSSFDAFLSIGLFLALCGLVERHFWKIGLLRRLGIVDFPDISGRWVGFLTSSYQRDGQNVVVPMTLEIMQNASSVFVRACFEKGHSDSVIADFEIINGRPCLIYVYDNTISSKVQRGAPKDKGVVMLEYLDEDHRMLKGKYFNDVKPQSNYGEIQVSYSGPKLLFTNT